MFDTAFKREASGFINFGDALTETATRLRRQREVGRIGRPRVALSNLLPPLVSGDNLYE